MSGYDQIKRNQESHQLSPLLATASQPLKPATVAGDSLMHCVVRLVTPVEAKELLRNNPSNRTLSRGHVNFFIAQLERGEMQVTHQGIAISESGKLLDGQHRLTAISKTGIAAKMLVTTGLPDSSFAVMDSGLQRKVSDAMHIGGAVNSTALAAALRLYICYKHRPDQVWHGGALKTLGTALSCQAEYEMDTDKWSWAARVASTLNTAKIVVPGPLTCMMYMALSRKGYSASYLETFVRRIKDGADLAPGSAILAYRNRALAYAGRPSGQERLADYIKLLNAHATGQQMKLFRPQFFPPMPQLLHAEESIHDAAAEIL